MTTDLVERFPVLGWVEASCRFDLTQSPSPGVVLWDRRFALWMVVFEETVCVAVGTELLEGNPIERAQAAQAYVQCLSDAGYDVLFDHQEGRLHSAGAASGLAGHLAAAGSSRWFRRIVLGCGLGLLLGSGTFLIGTVIVRAGLHGAAKGRWTDGVLALSFGAVIAALQYRVTRKGLEQEAQQIRNAIITSPQDQASLVFRQSAVIMALGAFAILLFGAFAAMALLSGNVLAVFFLATVCGCSAAFFAAGWGRVMSLDGDSIESHAHLGRSRRIAYEDVLQIVPWPALDLTVVSSEHEWLVVPDTFDLRGQFLTLLWNRVDLALKSEPAARLFDDAETLRQLRESLNAARHAGFHIRDAERTPIWMTLRRRDHPLRRQYAYHKLLLREGRVVIGRVLRANSTLLGRPRTTFDAPVIALYADGTEETSLRELLDRIAVRLTGPSDREAAEWFHDATASHRGFPLQLPLPEFLAEGRQVHCTSVMVVRRQIPLGSLRAPWLPLLVTPASPFTMILPMRLWGASIRDQWKRGL